MATAPRADSAVPLASAADRKLRFDAFISYSHADRQVAAGLQKGLARIGRRMGRLNALRVFRDATDLTASPDLWGKVRAALEDSRYLVVLLSPASKTSVWVNREVAFWLESRGPDRLMLVTVGGHLRWDEQRQGFDPEFSDIALPVMTRSGVFPTEPLFVDVTELSPWDIHNPVFRETVTDLAAPMHGKSKYELASDDVRELHRYRRWRRATVTGFDRPYRVCGRRRRVGGSSAAGGASPARRCGRPLLGGVCTGRADNQPCVSARPGG